MNLVEGFDYVSLWYNAHFTVDVFTVGTRHFQPSAEWYNLYNLFSTVWTGTAYFQPSVIWSQRIIIFLIVFLAQSGKYIYFILQ